MIFPHFFHDEGYEDAGNIEQHGIGPKTGPHRLLKQAPSLLYVLYE